jgi:hypothetical protein
MNKTTSVAFNVDNNFCREISYLFIPHVNKKMT